MIPPGAGLLCISDCATCPVICLSPPSPLDFKPPPSSPPPPRRLVLQPSPPESHCSDASPPPSPSNIVSVGATTTPPPPSNYSNIPATQAPPAKGQKNYTYPYYDFYVISKEDSLQLHSSIVLAFLVFFHSC